ncbi:MAG: hypothetical protein V7742_16625 [Halioglobus sp.]
MSGISNELRNFYCWHLTGLPLDEMEMNPTKAAAQALKVVQDNYNIVGFTDSLDTVMGQLKYRAGYSREFPGEFVNKGRPYKATDDLDASTLEAIREMNQVDIKLFELLSINYRDRDAGE